jgi:hypothetical protein
MMCCTHRSRHLLAITFFCRVMDLKRTNEFNHNSQTRSWYLITNSASLPQVYLNQLGSSVILILNGGKYWNISLSQKLIPLCQAPLIAIRWKLQISTPLREVITKPKEMALPHRSSSRPRPQSSSLCPILRTRSSSTLSAHPTPQRRTWSTFTR